MRFIFLLLLLPILGTAQFDTTKFYRSPNYGDLFRRAKINQLMIPSDTTTNKVGVAQIGQRLFLYNVNKWVEVGNFDTTSLSNRINLKLNISDTASMLNAYKHWQYNYTNKTYVDSGLSTKAAFFTASDPLFRSGALLGINNANSTTTGALTSTDWNTFNNKYNLPSLTNGSVLFSDGSTIAQDNTNFFWDNSLKRILLNGGLNLGSNSARQTIGTITNIPLDFISNNVLRGSISSNGNFGWGIGTNTPNANFHIGILTGDLQFRVGANTGGTRIHFGQDGLKNFFELNLGNDWLIGGWPTNDFRISRLTNNYFNINSITGNVGVRTIVDNGFNFNVNGHARISNGLSISSQGTDIATSQSITASSSGDFNFNNPSSSGWFFNWNQNGATRMRLSSNNNLLINTTTDAGFRLDVNGTARIVGKITQPTTANSPMGTATLVNGTVTISNTLATTGCYIRLNYRTGTTPTTTTSTLVVTTVTNNTSFVVTAYTPGTVTTNTSDNNVIEYQIFN